MGLLKKIKRKIEIAKLKKNIKGYRTYYSLYGSGDILYTLMYFKYLKENAHNNLAIIVNKKNFFEVAKLYDEFLSKIIISDLLLDHKAYENSGIITLTKKILEAAPGNHIRDMIRDALGVSKDVEPFIPQIKPSEKITRLFNELGMKENKTVVISPDAIACAEIIDKTYWNSFAEELEKLGYTVVFNTDKDNEFTKYKHIFLNIEDTINFVKLAGNFVAYRSGLADIVGTFCEGKQIILYPNNRDKDDLKIIKNYDEKPNQKYMDFYSLKYLYPEKDIKEMIFNKKINLIDEFK